MGKISLINSKRDFSIDRLHQLKPDKIFFAHWSYIIPKDILEEFECIVFHMTDLPFGRGGSPLQNLIARGIDKTKLSALRVSEGLDEGPIYLKKELSLYGTAEEIFIRANDLISIMIEEIILNNLSPSAQVGEAVLFKRRTPDMSSINSIDELNELFNHIRMLDASGYPHAYLNTPNFRLEFTRASLKADNSIIADVRITKK
ncbi:MAG: hypothetical protein JXQ96_04325 [Cyclobacteriaceae bacterium]